MCCAGEKMKAEMRVSYEEREGCSRALKCRIEGIYSDTEPDFNALNQNQKRLDLCHQTWKKKLKTANQLIQLEAKWQ